MRDLTLQLVGWGGSSVLELRCDACGRVGEPQRRTVHGDSIQPISKLWVGGKLSCPCGEPGDRLLVRSTPAGAAPRVLNQAYPGRSAVRVSALPEAVADEKATPAGSFALRLDEVTKVVSALREVLTGLTGAAGAADALREHCEAALIKAKLKPQALKDQFMKPFGKAKAK